MPSKKPTHNKFILNLVLLGDPGAGKATQAAFFAKKYKMFDYDMGRELTLLRQKNKAADAVMKQKNDKGILTPTAIVRKMNQENILKTSAAKGILFDGHPKMVGEAKLVAKLLKENNRTKPLVLYLKIPQHEMLDRIQNRKGYFNTKFDKRADDSTTALRNRAKYYRKNIAEVIEFFKTTYTFANIDGTGTRTQVRARIQKAINFYLKNYKEIYNER
ncbi:MAG TPA: nucleoside monophosphate kinase [Patescibacteria group bacterium]|jgi:adenylate kinase|nr:nucleoside monophosphate kinase [Patescibacteria group bacterium]